jgi:cyclic-di-GMP phosphodiesterase, flagellum assembly factor TipF
MGRISAVYVGFCMVLIAASIGAVLLLGLGLSWAESAIVAIAALTALALYDAVAKELRARSVLNERIAKLSGGMTDLAWQVADLTRQVGELGRRLTVSERKTESAADQTRTAIPEFASEIDELGTIVQQLAETVAVHEDTITEQHATSDGAETPAATFADISPSTATPRQDQDAFIIREPETFAPTETHAAPVLKDEQPKILAPDQKIAIVRSALDAGRAELYLQPVVSLPQRKVRYYETFTRLRTEDGKLLLPSDFINAAELGGLISRIDHLALTRAAQVARWLLNKNRDIGLICNIATATLTQPQSCQQLLQFFETNQELAQAIVLEFPQSFWRANSPLAQPGLVALVKLGARFSMDRVTDLRMEPRDLADRNIRLVKIPAKMLLSVSNMADFDIHPADLPNLMARFGIGLVAERIEAEETVLELLEQQVRFGQGFLFSAPRPLRAEALQSAPEATSEIAAKTPEPAPARQTIANAVEDLRRAGILPQTAPGGSRA